MSSRQVAAKLGYTKRHINRIAERLGEWMSTATPCSANQKSSNIWKDAMGNLDPAAEQKLADLSDVDWAALTARVRPPSSAAQLKEIAGRVITGDALEAFVNVADIKSLAGENGDIDENRVMGVLTGMFGIANQAEPAHEDFGQHRMAPSMPGPGDRGRAEAAKRFGTQGEQTAPMRGRAGAAEAERRLGKKGRS